MFNSYVSLPEGNGNKNHSNHHNHDLIMVAKHAKWALGGMPTVAATVVYSESLEKKLNNCSNTKKKSKSVTSVAKNLASFTSHDYYHLLVW